MTGLPESAANASEERAGAATYVVRIVVVVAVVVLLAFIGRIIRNRFLSTEQLLQRADAALDETPQPDFETARQSLLRVLDREPDSNRANLLMATIASRTERIDEALDYAGRIEDDGSPEAVRARCLAGELLLHHRLQPSAALAQFQRACEQDPGDGTANTYLAHLHRVGLRTRDMTPYSLYLARRGLLAPQQLLELGLGHELRAVPTLIDQYARVAADDPIVLVGQADIARGEGDFDRAEELFRRVIEEHPDILAAHVRLGEVFLEARDARGFYEWNGALPETAEQHPLTWSIRGCWAEELGATAVAVRCYWESVRRDPDYLPAVYRLGQLLTAVGRSEDAVRFVQRADMLELYAQQARSVILLTDRNQPDLEGLYYAAWLAKELGLVAEANAWISLIQQVDETNQRAQRMQVELEDRLSEITTQRSDANPADQLDLSEYPLPDWTPPSAPELSQDPAADPTVVTFQNQAADAGLEFQFFTGNDPQVRGLSRVWCVNGGGVAILDLDCDGWPDIHLTQGADFSEQSAQHLDRLYRNTGRGRFSDVTGRARVAEDRYSQGASVGDFNGDGFPDLHVANIGGNRLYQNNGDGTFTDVSDRSGVVSGTWTTSCLLADLNGDGLPDLYDVNFLAGPEVFTTICRDAQGRHHACQPVQFEPSQDELFLNRGDGTFANVTGECGILALQGRGLGIVAGDFDGTGKLNLFVANAAAANFYFVNETEDAAGGPQFADKAILLGAAYNRVGHADTGRGVAAGDADQDGQLELFITSAFNESNALYDRQEHLFLESASSAGLGEPGRKASGFGAQFIDGALRGALDLIVANGHIDDWDLPGIPYEMPPAYFSNIGGGRFAELDAAVAGPYFEGARLGRALARVDWNRDGREDVVVCHLDAPAALLTNTTQAAGRHLAIRLIGVQSARDAIGTTLTLITGDGRTLSRQLTAGDGFQASNQRIVVFGLGEAPVVDALRIRWPSGSEQQFTDVAPDREYFCVEGRDRLFAAAP